LPGGVDNPKYRTDVDCHVATRKNGDGEEKTVTIVFVMREREWRLPVQSWTMST